MENLNVYDCWYQDPEWQIFSKPRNIMHRWQGPGHLLPWHSPYILRIHLAHFPPLPARGKVTTHIKVRPVSLSFILVTTFAPFPPTITPYETVGLVWSVWTQAVILTQHWFSKLRIVTQVYCRVRLTTAGWWDNDRSTVTPPHGL